MLETAVALALGHLIADFLLQTNAMIAVKHSRPEVLFLHVAIVILVTWAALGFAVVPLLLLLIAVTHIIADWTKLHLAGPGFRPFGVDQAAHFAFIALGAALFPGAYAAGLWGLLADGPAGPWVALLPRAMTLAGGIIATVWAGGYAVQALMSDFKVADPHIASSLPLGGQLIGRLERLVILMFVLARQPEGIGLLIAAKSILRFNELARDADRQASEYVIIGTLASFAWAIGMAWATRAVLDTLAP